MLLCSELQTSVYVPHFLAFNLLQLALGDHKKIFYNSTISISFASWLLFSTNVKVTTSGRAKKRA
jgi:hypothetical protein